MNIILISLQRDLETIGLKSLHYVLLKNGFNSELLYLPRIKIKNHAQLEAVKEFVAERLPSFIGISLMSLEYFAAADLTDKLKQWFPDIPVIWGGIHPTMDPKSCLLHCDYVCIGEGETAVLDFARTVSSGGDLTLLNNICYMKDGMLVKNPLNPLILDVDSLPVVDHLPKNGYVLHGKSIYPIDNRLFRKYTRWGGVVYNTMGSRGCLYKCAYCCNNAFARLYPRCGIRRRSVGSIIRELEKVVKENRDIRFINFQDDCFLACTDEYLHEFCRSYKEKIGLPFIAHSVPGSLTDKRLKLLKEAGLAWLLVGLQSGSDETNINIYNRKTASSEFLKAAHLIQKNRIAAIYDVITDNPFEQDDARIVTVGRVMDIPKPFFLELFSLTFYPGTELYERALRECPDAVEDCRKKDYYRYRKNSINHMLRMAAYLNPKIMNDLLEDYQKNRNSLSFKVCLFFWRLVSAFLCEPLTYIKIISLSENISLTRAVCRLPLYAKQVLNRYINQWI